MPPDPFELLAEWAAPTSQGALERFYDDPVAFARECIEWPEKQSLSEYQVEILAALPEHKKVCVRSLHSAGKTTTAAIALLWFALTRDAAEVDWKCAVTAGSWRQLERFLFPEVAKWARCLRWDAIGRPPFDRHELLKLNLNLQFGSAFAVASDVPALIEGVHADALLYILDEAKAIPADTFDAIEGAFAGKSEAMGLASSTPGEPSGRFFDIQTQKPGLDDWRPIHVSLERAIGAGRVSLDWAEQRKKQWGESSALYANRVLGQFHSSDGEGVIPLSWVEAAIERWEVGAQRNESGALLLPADPLDRLGADIARSGADSTVLALRYGHRIHELRTSSHEDTMQTVGRIAGILLANPSATATVDTDGLGAGVTDRLREQGLPVQAFHAGAKSDRRDRSKELGFVNVKAAAWWLLRELLDPAFDSKVELPPDDLLLADLTAPHWKVASNSRVQIESKDEVKKRLGRSTDRGDAVVQSFWELRKRRRARMFDSRLLPVSST